MSIQIVRVYIVHIISVYHHLTVINVIVMSLLVNRIRANGMHCSLPQKAALYNLVRKGIDKDY